jgi:hypothetical protein
MQCARSAPRRTGASHPDPLMRDLENRPPRHGQDDAPRPPERSRFFRIETRAVRALPLCLAASGGTRYTRWTLESVVPAAVVAVDRAVRRRKA